MTKTLRITSILIAVLAVFLLLPMFFGSSIDQEKEKFLNTPSVVDNFKKNRAGRSTSKVDEVSPLVKQAQALALYLNPPPKPKPLPLKQSAKTPQKPRPPAKVATKFNLIGTSYYRDRPEKSLALIDEPGKGLHWVRQSAEIGHLIIEQVKDGIVVIKDGQRTYELVSQRPIKKSLVKGETPIPSKTSNTPTILPPKTPVAPKPVAPVKKDTKKPKVTGPKEPTPEELSEMENLMKIVEALESKKGSPLSDEELMQVFMESDKISEKEAQNLELLGKQLENAEKEPNITQSNKITQPKVPVKRQRTRRRSK